MDQPTAIIILGVAGAGKTTIGHRLAQTLGWSFIDADDLHTLENIERMRDGMALTDAQRAPWLMRLGKLLKNYIDEGSPVVLACSALKQSYREQLRVANSVRFVYLRGSIGLFRERLRTRPTHYMKAPMLAGQLATLEEPRDALVIDAALPLDETVARICAAFELRS